MWSLNKQKNEKIKEFNSNLSEHKFNLYQQFLIVGIDPKLMFRINTIDIKSIQEPYIYPKIISKYPPDDLYYLNIPDKVIASHCFPKGILNTILDYNESNYDKMIKYQKNFVFSLENQYPQEKNSSLRIKKVYYSCLLFYENIKNYHECLIYKNKLLKYSKKELDNLEEKNKGLLIPKVICLSSFRPFFEQSKVILESLKKYVDNYLYNNITKDNFNIYPIEKIIEGLIYNLPALPRSSFIIKLDKDTFETNCIDNNKDISINSNKDINKLNKNKILNNDKNEIIFYETPFNKQPKNIINYSILMKYFRIKEVFEIIKFILLEEPILFFCEDIHILTYIIEGLISLIYPFEYQYPIISILPEENFSFISIYKHFIFGINNKYSEDIFQKKGIFLDDKKYIIIIKLEKRFENILNNDEEDKLKYSVITSILSDSSKPFVKIEQDKIDDFEKIDSIHNIENENSQEKRKLTLPMHYFEKCTKRLEKNTLEKFKEYSNKIKNKKPLTLEEKEYIFNNEIRKTFIYFFSCILLRYQSFCVKFEKNIEVLLNQENQNINKNNSLLDSTIITNAKLDTSAGSKDFDFFLERNPELEKKFILNKLEINDIFNSKNFIEENDTPKLDRPFYKQFFETKLFFEFIKKKIFPNSLEDKLDILYFDYKVNEKLSRGSRKLKVETKFFSEDLESLSGEISINSLKKMPSQNFNEFLNNEKNFKNGINYFQIMQKGIKKSLDKNNLESISETETTDTGGCIISLYKVSDDADSNIDDSSSGLNVTGKISNLNNEDMDENEEDNKNKIKFSYFVFPKLFNDGIFFKENILLEELEGEKDLISDKNNFNIRNCKCLYNQFEKEAHSFIKNPIIQKNYKLYEYNLNSKFRYRYKYEECINKLWILYLSKTFHAISFSKRRYYFEEILKFLNDKNNVIDPDTILLFFNEINKYGDRNMNQELFMYLNKKSYTNFLCLREKTSPENNFIKYMNKEKKNYSERKKDNDNNIPENLIQKIALEFNDSKKSQSKKIIDFYIYEYCSPNLKENIEVDLKEENLINLDMDLEQNQTNDNDDNSCGEQLNFNIKDLFQNESNKKYVELKCPKCNRVQNVTITCFYTDDNDNKYQLNFNLVSPLALQKETWFKNFNKLYPLNISEEYPEEYLSALFYFYEQGLPANFLIPKGRIKQDLKKVMTGTYNNIDPMEEIYLNYKVFCHKKSVSFMNSPSLRRKNINIKERINIFEMKKDSSPKKSSLMKRSKFTQKMKTNEFNLNTKNVTFSCFKK